MFKSQCWFRPLYNVVMGNTPLLECGIVHVGIQGRQTGGGGLGGSQPPLNFGWGVEHLSTPPDFEKKIFRGGWLPLN